MLKIRGPKWHIDFSSFEKQGRKEFAQKLKNNSVVASETFRVFVENLNNEAKETRDASKLVVKYLKKGKLTKEEEHELKKQFYDLLKVMGIGVPFFTIPGASILIPFLVKLAEKRGIDLMPSSFSKSSNIKKKN